MKKILFTFFVMTLMAAGCNSPEQSAKPSTTQTSTAQNTTVASTSPVTIILQVGKISPDVKQIKEIQQAVDQGHQPWRLDPQSVLIATLFPNGLANKDADSAVRQLSFNSQTGVAVYAVTSGANQYHVTVSQPVIGEHKIWFVSDIEMAT
jgi:hypothetical protein